MDIVAFASNFDRSAFECGKPDLDEWLQRYSKQSERADTTRTFLAVTEDDVVIGYYALKAYELDLDDAARAYGVGKRRYPVPAMMLARLAVAEDAQGRGIGKALLVDALVRLVDVSHSVGFEIVVVDAIDHDASTFYRQFGFVPFQDHQLRLYLTVKSLRKTFDSLP